MKRKYKIPEATELTMDNLGKIMNKSTSEELLKKFSDNSFLNFREVSEVYNMGLLEKAVDIFDDMYGSDKTLDECAEKRGIHNINEIFRACYVQSLIRFFTENREEYFGGLTDDRELLNRLNMRFVNVIEGNKSHRAIIKEIRNALSHRRYIIGQDGLCIYNPKSKMHKQSFKATIKWEYLNDIWKISEVSQNFRFHKFDDQSVDYSKEFKDNVGKFSYFKFNKTKNANKSFKFEDFGTLEAGSLSENDFYNDETLSKQHLLLSRDQIDVIQNFFKNYQFNSSNLEEVLGHIEDWKHLYDHFYMGRFFSNVDEFNFTCKDLFPVCYFDESLGVNVRISRGFFSNHCVFSGELSPANLVDDYCIHLVPTYLKTIYIINSYLNDTRVKMGTIDETTHIRHAFAHGNYSLIPGVEEILLYDPKCDYHGKFNINDLYKKRKEYETQRKENLKNSPKKKSD